MTADRSTTKDPNSSRKIPYSEAFRKFIVSDWEPYSTELPQRLPAADHTPARHQEVSTRFRGATLVIPAGPMKVRSNDTDYRFRPHTAFAWLSGLGEDREPQAVLVIQSDATPILFIHPRAPRSDEEFYSNARYGEMWVGKRDSLEEMSARVGYETRHINELDQFLGDAKKLLVLREADPAITAKVDEVRGGTDDGDDELATVASELRMSKDAFEIGEMRRAVDATRVGFEAVARELPNAVAGGRGERWVEGIFALHARHLGNAVGYDTIAAGGNHANTLHWIRNDGELRDGDLLLLDAGVEVDSLYTADVTRTLPVNGTFSPAQRHVYEVVLAAQQAGIEACRPGAQFTDPHMAAIRVIAEFLDELGILPVSVEESLDQEVGGQHRRWMVHGTSHHLGLDVHDCAAARAEVYRMGTLGQGMIITVEPGIYFRADDLLVPEEYRGIGIRIEDDILITADGYENLSAALPRDPDEVEAWIRKQQA